MAHKGPFVEPVRPAVLHERIAEGLGHGIMLALRPGVGSGHGLGQAAYAAPGCPSGLASTPYNLCPALFHLQMERGPSGKSSVHRKGAEGGVAAPVKVVSLPCRLRPVALRPGSPVQTDHSAPPWGGEPCAEERMARSGLWQDFMGLPPYTWPPVVSDCPLTSPSDQPCSGPPCHSLCPSPAPQL